MSPRETGGWWRSPLMGAAIVASALALASCGDDDDATTTTTAAGPGTIATTVPASAPDSSTATTAVTVTSSGATLADAITAVGGRYRFTASVSVGGVETTHVEGSVYDGAGQYLVTSGDSEVEYIIGPSGQWARQGNAPWAILAGPAPVVDPLSPLVQPFAISVVSSEGDDSVIEATYDASTLGFSEDEDVVVTLTIVDGVLTEIRYTAAVGGDEALVVTTLDTDSEMTPITVPTP